MKTKNKKSKDQQEELSEQLARTRANLAIINLKISGLERRTRWLKEDEEKRKGNKS